MKRVAEPALVADSVEFKSVAADVVIVDLPAPMRIAAAVVGAIEMNLREEEPAEFALALCVAC